MKFWIATIKQRLNTRILFLRELDPRCPIANGSGGGSTARLPQIRALPIPLRWKENIDNFRDLASWITVDSD